MIRRKSNRGYEASLIFTSVALLLASACGETISVPEGSCSYEVKLEEECLDLSGFRALTLVVTDDAGLVRGFNLDAGNPTWSDVVKEGDVAVNLAYEFHPPGLEVGGEFYQSVPSEFTDTCTGGKTSLIVDCSALPVGE